MNAFGPAAERRDLVGHHAVEGGQHVAEPLRIERGRELGRTGQVGEDHGDHPSLRRRRHRDRRAAVRAEVRARRQRCPQRGQGSRVGRRRRPPARCPGRAARSCHVLDQLHGVAVGVADGREPREPLDLADVRRRHVAPRPSAHHRAVVEIARPGRRRCRCPGRRRRSRAGRGGPARPRTRPTRRRRAARAGARARRGRRRRAASMSRTQ